MTMMLSVITPVYRSKSSLVPLYEQILKTIKSIPAITDYEIIMVEDCGGDGSWEVIQELAANDPHLKGLKLSRNFGQHRAITAGMDLCRGDWVIVMDCDLQDNPSAIVSLWNKAQEGYDVVNVRRQKRADPFVKRLQSRIFHAVFEWLGGMKYDPQVANYRIFSRKVVEAFNSMRESSRGLGIQIHWLGFSTAFIDVPHSQRYDGKSSYTLRRLISLAVDVAVSYSNKPLRISIVLGLFIALCSFVSAIWVFIKAYYYHIPVHGWASLMVSLWFLGGIIITNLGVLGVYIGKIYDETKHRPIYAIDKRLNC